MLGDRILMLIPHPGDEVIGCTVASLEAGDAGCRLYGLYLTCGVPLAEGLWSWQRPERDRLVAARRAEAEAAAVVLGIEPIVVRPVPARRLKDEIREAHRAIRSAVKRLRPDMMWVPAYEGGHHDHDVASFLGTLFNSDIEVWEYALYNHAGGRVNRQRFAQSLGSESAFALEPAEIDTKTRAVAAYATRPEEFDALALECETLRPLAAYDYARPPHAGRLYYERHRWLPFSHPRIDHTDPAAVSAALVAYAR